MEREDVILNVSYTNHNFYNSNIKITKKINYNLDY